MERKTVRRFSSWMRLAAAVLAAPWLAMAAESAGDTGWPTYNNTVDGQRFAALDQIDISNAASLTEVCRTKIDESGAFHSSFVLIDRTLYLTTAHDTIAIDPTNCKVRWRNVYKPEQTDVFGVNRGVAYSNGILFRGTPDARLLAIDAATGKTLWKQQVGDPGQGEFFSSAPVVWQGLLIIGAAGSDWGIRGRIMAYDQQTGREVWRFHTIPRGKEIGADTWKTGDTARYGGGGSWTTYTLDMATGEVFVPVGNPAPDFVPDHRPGDNLFADSMVVLDARTGELKWWFQMIRNDGHDLDLGAAPMLYWTSKGVPMVAIGSKDGYIYGVNRETHEKVFQTAITTIENEGVRVTKEGVHACPGVLGGVEWNGPAFDRKNKHVVVGTVDWCALFKSAPVDYQPGGVLLAGSWIMDEKNSGWVHAIDPDKGDIVWKYHADAPIVSGVTPTDGNVIFTGDMSGNFLVLDSTNGKELFRKQTGGALAGGMITYSLDGTQYVAFASGNVSRLSFGVSGSPTFVLYALPKKAREAKAKETKTEATSPMAAALAVPDAKHGKAVYETNCAACHGANGEGLAGPTLKGIAKKLDAEQTVKWIKQPSAKMPKLFPSPLKEQDVSDVAAFIRGF